MKIIPRPHLGRRGELSGGGQQEQQTRGVQQRAADDESIAYKGQLRNILKLVLQIMTAECEHQRPQDILRVGRQVYVVYSGGEAAQPAVVRYRLQPGGERD